MGARSGGAEPASRNQGLLFDREPTATASSFARELREFASFGSPTAMRRTRSHDGRLEVPAFVNEFWTARQRQAHPLHEISFRACFKPQLPRFFVERLSRPGGLVYDPFMGRGTAPLEAALLGRTPLGCDVNPLSRVLVEPRLEPPESADAVARRLAELDWEADCTADLLAFYHEETLAQIEALRRYLLAREATGTLDPLDRWIRMVAVNRLTGHSPGFFSVYTMPPNQAVSAATQRKLNEKRGQTPPRRDVPALIVKKTGSLLARLSAADRAALARARERALWLSRACDDTPEIEDDSVELVVTSPPFLDVVQYRDDNWLRCWFCGIDAAAVPITVLRQLDDWQCAMTRVFEELRRVLVPGGRVAFEVGEVRGGKVSLDEVALACGADGGLEPELVVINDQRFTKTANCWGIDNNRKGTNTNRIALFRKR